MMTDWNQLKARFGGSRYLFASVRGIMSDPNGSEWLTRLRAEAPRFGAEVTITDGLIWISWPQSAQSAA